LKKICPFDKKPCFHDGSCEVVSGDSEGHEVVLFRCKRFMKFTEKEKK